MLDNHHKKEVLLLEVGVDKLVEHFQECSLQEINETFKM